MKGTEKQVAWASELQQKAITAFEWARLNPPPDGQSDPARSYGIDLMVNRIQSAGYAGDVIDTFRDIDFSASSGSVFVQLVSAMNSKKPHCNF